MSYSKMYEIVSKTWLCTDDIQELCCCCKCSATKIRKEIEKKVKSDGKQLPCSSRKLVPTKYVLEYLGFDIDFIYDMKLKEGI